MLWTQQDRFGNDIYLTHERWQHITDLDNHPELSLYAEYVQDTIRHGRRRQDTYDPQSYRYYAEFPDLPDDNTHIVVCVRFRWATAPDETVHVEKFVTTAYMQFF